MVYLITQCLNGETSTRRATDNFSLSGENDSILTNILSFIGTALQGILSRMMYTGFSFEALFLRYLSISF